MCGREKVQLILWKLIWGNLNCLRCCIPIIALCHKFFPAHQQNNLPSEFSIKAFFPLLCCVTFESDLTRETDSITMRLSLSAPLWYNCLYCWTSSSHLLPTSPSFSLSPPLSTSLSLSVPLIFIKHFRESILQLFSLAICQFSSIKWSREYSTLLPALVSPHWPASSWFSKRRCTWLTHSRSIAWQPSRLLQPTSLIGQLDEPSSLPLRSSLEHCNELTFQNDLHNLSPAPEERTETLINTKIWDQ